MNTMVNNEYCCNVLLFGGYIAAFFSSSIGLCIYPTESLFVNPCVENDPNDDPSERCGYLIFFFICLRLLILLPIIVIARFFVPPFLIFLVFSFPLTPAISISSSKFEKNINPKIASNKTTNYL